MLTMKPDVRKNLSKRFHEAFKISVEAESLGAARSRHV